ncbi:MAG: hypothetical protein CMP07_00240 [Xanthomonadales bacterium]|nr:hypothetical protein [Xanthomonadales bacterium]
MNRSIHLLAAAAIALASCIGAQAATITVNNVTDTVADDGVCTLREAIIAANTNTASGASSGECVNGTSGFDFIEFGLLLVPVTIQIDGNPLPDVTEPLVITGPGRAALSISGNGTAGILASSAELIISGLALEEAGGSGNAAIRMNTPADLTLSDCEIRDTTAQNGGGAIVFQGDAGGTTLTIDDCRFVNNQMTNAAGGTLSVSATSGPALVDITNSEFIDNAGGNGAAIFLFLPGIADPGEIIGLSVVDTTFSGNVSSGSGGAIHSASSNHAIRIRRSTFENNEAAGSGGAAFLSESDVQITNSTFHGNAAGDDAGALWMVNALPNTATIASSTITGNTANGNGGSGRGGGIAGQAQDILLRNTIIAENIAPDGTGPDCADQPVSDGYNLIGAVNDCTFGAITGDQTGNLASPLSPVLGPIADNGGPTRTRLPLASSPALDFGNPGGCLRADGVALVTDQRGETREADGDEIGGPRCDIGAAEVVPIPTFELSVSTTPGGSVQSNPAGIDCPGDCSEEYEDGTLVELTPSAEPGFTFNEFTGDCTGSGTCQITMDQARSVQASFADNRELLLVEVFGEGRVTSTPSGIDCPGTCSAPFVPGTVVSLSPQAETGFAFLAWGGDCSGDAGCQVTMDASRLVEAVFSNDAIVVNSNADTVADDGECTLREAINSARFNAPSGSSANECSAGSPSPAEDVITFTADVTGSILVTGRFQTVSEPLAIHGPGRDVLALDATNSPDGVFATSAPLSFHGLTVRNAVTTGNDNTFQVGAPAIFSECRFADNSSDGAGALFVLGDVTIDRCVFERNTASEAAGGGAIFGNNPNLSILISRSRFSQNEATSGSGGALRLSGSGTVVDIVDSTFDGNSADAGGGGVSVSGSDLLVTNSTFSGNESGSFGGGLVVNAGATLSIASSTIAGNSARAGGGLSSGIPAADASLRNTILAGNTDSDNGVEPDCSGNFTTGGHNIVGIPGSFCSGFVDTVDGDQVGDSGNPINPLLGPLADNGGPTPTRALLPGSPAIEAGNPAGCADALGVPLTQDQRGQPRPAPSGTPCDVGAFEDFADLIFLDGFE